MQGITPYNLKIISEVFGGKAYPLELLKLLDDNPVIVDLGANVGAFSLACNTLRADVKLIAVEPDPNNFIALKANLALTNAELYQVALTDKNGTVALFLGEQDAVTNSIFLGKMVSEKHAIDVQSRETKKFLEEIFQRHGKISLLKSDTEGAEWHLLSLTDEFFSNISMIFIEYHSSSFLEKFLTRILQSHVIYSGTARFPNRGEFALVHKSILSNKQADYEISSPELLLK